MNKKKIHLNNKEEIDIIKSLSNIWNNKTFILKSTLIFVLFGLAYSLSIKNIYRANSIFYPHIEKLDNSNDLRNLAGLAGFNLEMSTTDNIPSNLYPKLIKSPSFKIKILDENVNVDDKEITYRNYLLLNRKSNFISQIISYPILLFNKLIGSKNQVNKKRSINIINLSDQEYSLHNYLDNAILLNLNQKEGFIELSVDDTDPLIASQIAQASEKQLQQSIIDFKIKNIKSTFDFTSTQLDIAKKNFYLLQDSLARFKDKNRNIRSDLFLNQLNRIEAEYNISNNIYNELALTKERISIDVEKNTPIFTIIKPVILPNEKESPKRSFIVIFFTLFGFIISCFYFVVKEQISNIYFQIKKS